MLSEDRISWIDLTSASPQTEALLFLPHHKIRRVAGRIPQSQQLAIHPGDEHLKATLLLRSDEFPDQAPGNSDALSRENLMHSTEHQEQFHESRRPGAVDNHQEFLAPLNLQVLQQLSKHYVCGFVGCLEFHSSGARLPVLARADFHFIVTQVLQSLASRWMSRSFRSHR